MPFPFALPTTSHLTFQNHLLCSTHPSLPSAATSARNLVRSALKSHKRLPDSQQSNNLRTVHAALQSYIPYLLTIDAALSGRRVAGEEIDLALTSEIEVEWRPVLASSTVPGRDAQRVKGKSLDYEIYAVLSTLANLHSLLARDALLTLYAPVLPTPEARLAAVQSATKSLSTASSVFTYLLTRSTADPPTLPAGAIDLQPSTLCAQSSYTLATLTLLYVLKDDPYPALVTQSRSKTDKEWMIHAPTVSKVRAHLLARLCLSAAEHAARGSASLSSAPSSLSSTKGTNTIHPAFPAYLSDLARSARAKACRFLGLDADLAGRAGEAIAWLHAGLAELDVDVPPSETSSAKVDLSGKLSRLKVSLAERREEKKLASAAAGSASGGGSDGGSAGSSKAWGTDAGKAEESRVQTWLLARWTRMNDTVNVQVVPEWRGLLRSMPSGRDMPAPGVWVGEKVDAAVLEGMRAPVEEGDREGDGESSESSGDEEGVGGSGRRDVIGSGSRNRTTPGAFPGAGTGEDAYY